LGWLPGCAPSQLLHTCPLAEYGRLEKVLGLIATTENISVINILLVLNPNHSSYWEENELYPSQKQDNSNKISILAHTKHFLFSLIKQLHSSFLHESE